jgi:hypothetical protein
MHHHRRRMGVRRRRRWRCGFFDVADEDGCQYNGMEEWAGQAMPLGVEMRLVEFGRIGFGPDIILQSIGEVVVYFVAWWWFSRYYLELSI